MAKSRSSTRKKPVYSKIKDPAKPTWMRITKVIAIMVFSAVLLLSIAGIVIKYYRLITK